MYLETWSPTDRDLENLPHIQITLQHQWNPHQVKLPGTSHSAQEELESRNIAKVKAYCFVGKPEDQNYTFGVAEEGYDRSEEVLHDMEGFSKRLVSSVRITADNARKVKPSHEVHQQTVASMVSMMNHQDITDHIEYQERNTFVSSERHTNTTPEDLSERWGLSIAQAALTLKATTQRLVRSAVLPLSRRYRADRMFEVKRIRGEMSTDTMDARVTSIHGDKYAQIFASKEFFVEAYPIKTKGDCHEALKEFIKTFGAMDSLTYDGSNEQSGHKSKFQATMRKYDIKGHTSEPERSKQNPCEGVIRELRRWWYRTMFKTYCPPVLWSYGYKHVAKIMQVTASYAGKLQGRTPLEFITGETPDISEYLDFGFYDRVWYRENAGIGETKLGRFICVSHTVGNPMLYWVMAISGVVESCTTVQCVTSLEALTDNNIKQFEVYD